MQAYPPLPQKSSDLLPVDYMIDYGFPMSIAAEAIKQGKAAHMRIYEAALRYGLEGLLLTAAELVEHMRIVGIALSPAQAQRILTDNMLFEFVESSRNGKRGRPKKRYQMRSPKSVAKALGYKDWGAERDAPRLRPEDLASARRYKLAIFGRIMVVRYEDSRQTQVRHWQFSRQTLIRWTQITCHIWPQIERRRSDNRRYSWYGDENDAQLFLQDVATAMQKKPHKYWLEVVNHAGEIRKLPCSTELARQWLAKGMVTLCEQRPNLYGVRAGYCDVIRAEDLWM